MSRRSQHDYRAASEGTGYWTDPLGFSIRKSRGKHKSRNYENLGFSHNTIVDSIIDQRFQRCHIKHANTITAEYDPLCGSVRGTELDYPHREDSGNRTRVVVTASCSLHPQ
jgi:hypothetical protein